MITKNLIDFVNEVAKELYNKFEVVRQDTSLDFVSIVLFPSSLRFRVVKYADLSCFLKSNELIINVTLSLQQILQSFSDSNKEILKRINEIAKNNDLRTTKQEPWYSFLISGFKKISQLNPITKVYFNVTIGEGVYCISSLVNESGFTNTLNHAIFQVSENLNTTPKNVAKKIEQLVLSLEEFLSNDSIILICLSDYIKEKLNKR